MLCKVQKHGGQRLLPESVAQLRNLDRAACILDDSPLPNCPIRDIVLTERDKQLLAKFRDGSPALHCLSLCHGQKASKEPSVVISRGLCSAASVFACSWPRSISKAMKGLVGGAAQGSADCRKNWTTALLPRSSGIGTHPTIAESAGAARIAWGGGRYKAARSAMREQGRTRKKVSLRCLMSNCRP